MNSSGFLPLIEAFLAFALTMLALATAVAAIVSVWQRSKSTPRLVNTVGVP